MKKILLFAVAITLIFGAIKKAEADVLDFEGLTGSFAEDITENNQGYGGLNWDFGWFLYSDDFYPTPPHSVHYGIVNNFGDDPLGVSSASPFDFDGVWVTGWYFNSPQQIKAQGLDAGNNVVVETDFFSLLTDTPQFLEANFQDVYRVNFVGGQFYALDDFTTGSHDEGAPVPEPATLALLGTGLAGLLFRGRRSA